MNNNVKMLIVLFQAILIIVLLLPYSLFVGIRRMLIFLANSFYIASVGIERKADKILKWNERIMEE